jgi:hypothetical protein
MVTGDAPGGNLRYALPPRFELRGRPRGARVVAYALDHCYIPTAWYPESTYSVVAVTLRAASESR